MNDNLADCAVSLPQWTWRDKIRRRLFPSKTCQLPNRCDDWTTWTTVPGAYKDVLVCRVTCQLSMLDRLRVLVTGRAQIESKTVTENIIGAHATKSEFTALPPKCWE